MLEAWRAGAAGRGIRGLWLYSSPMTEIADTFDSAFTKAVDLGNRLADRDKDADLWDIADGLLARGASILAVFPSTLRGSPVPGLHAYQHG